MTTASTAQQGAHYDSHRKAIVIDHLTITDQAVVAESYRWSTGRRGPSVSPEEMRGVDLSGFATQAITVGAHAIGSAGGIQETFNLQGLVNEVGERTAEAAAKAAKATAEVTTKAALDMETAATSAKKAIAEAGSLARQGFADNVDSAKKALSDEIERLVGGDQPELLTRLAPLLDRFGRDLDERSDRQTSALIDRVVRQFDPADPTSPMSKHASELARQQASLTATLETNHKALEAKVDELSTTIKVAKSAAATASVTTLKGETYAQGIHRVMTQIAAGLGDEYSDTSSTAGLISRCKKGDAVLAIDGGRVNVVLEMTDSTRTAWNPYLDEAERNRNAQASLGLVRSADQLNGNGLQSFGSRRIVLAFDPEQDDPDLLRTVVQILRLSALTAAARRDGGEIQTAQEKVAEALALLGRIDGIKKIAGQIKQSASKIDLDSDGLRTDLARLLSQAQSALAGAAGTVAGHEAA